MRNANKIKRTYLCYSICWWKLIDENDRQLSEVCLKIINKFELFKIKKNIKINNTQLMYIPVNHVWFECIKTIYKL